MTPTLASAVAPLLRRLDPEHAHRIALLALRHGLAGQDRGGNDPALAVEALGLSFANPIGLAAGFDKNAVAVPALRRLGFGLVETGTVTLRPQPGNPRPRLFRLPDDRAVINRMGFNNAGLTAYVAELARLPSRGDGRTTATAGTPMATPADAAVGAPEGGPSVDAPLGVPVGGVPVGGAPVGGAPVGGAPEGGPPVGANIGINKLGADPVRDYPALVAAVAPYADYVVINVSSPNTPGLRDLQNEAQLRAILQAIARAVPRRPPLLVKIAPDLPPDGLAPLVETCVAEGVQGLIISNTTVGRPPGLRSAHASETGGLSGAPLFALSTAMLARAFLLARGRLTLVGGGGVFSGQDAFSKIAAGATLVQVYTSFAYAGPALVPRLKAELAAALRAAGFAHVGDAVGCQAERLAAA